MVETSFKLGRLEGEVIEHLRGAARDGSERSGSRILRELASILDDEHLRRGTATHDPAPASLMLPIDEIGDRELGAFEYSMGQATKLFWERGWKFGGVFASLMVAECSRELSRRTPAADSLAVH